MDDTGSALEFSDLFLGVILRAGKEPKQMIVCERDGELYYKTTTDGGKTWTEFKEI
jgi:Neuraminidase (sialidase)